MLYLPIKAYSHEMRIEQVLNIQSMSWKTAADRNWISSECSTSKETWLSESFTNLFKTVVHLDVSQQNPSFIKKYKHQKFRSMNQELSCLGGWVFAWRDFLELAGEQEDGCQVKQPVPLTLLPKSQLFFNSIYDLGEHILTWRLFTAKLETQRMTFTENGKAFQSSPWLRGSSWNPFSLSLDPHNTGTHTKLELKG